MLNKKRKKIKKKKRKIKNAPYLLVVVLAHVAFSPPDQTQKPQFPGDLSFFSLVAYQTATSGGAKFNQPGGKRERVRVRQSEGVCERKKSLNGTTCFTVKVGVCNS